MNRAGLHQVSLRTRLLWLVGAALVPVAIFAVYGVLVLGHQQQSQLQQALVERARAVTSAVDHQLSNSVAALNILALSKSLDSGDIKRFYADASSAAATRSDWDGVILIDLKGNRLLNTRIPYGAPLPGGSPVVERDSFAAILASGNPSVGNIVKGPAGHHRYPIRVPVIRGGKPKYILTAVVKPDVMREILRHQKVPAESVSTIFDGTMTIVARSRNHAKYVGTSVSETLRPLIASAPEGWGLATTLEGQQVYSAFSRSGTSPWGVALGVPKGAADAPIRRSYAISAAGIVLSLALGAIMSAWVARRIARPIRQLHAAAQAVGRGEVPAMPPAGIPELDEVSSALASTSRGLRASEERLRQLNATLEARVEQRTRQLAQSNVALETFAAEARRAEEKFRALAETASDAILSADEEGKVVYANPAAERLFGYTLAELVGQPLTFLMPKRFRAAHLAGFSRYLAGGPARVIGKKVAELAARRKDSSEFPVELSLGEWRAGEERRFTAVIRDISRRREMEQRVRSLNNGLERRAAELAASNKELEAFSYSVSHDLRAPLRSIHGFSEALLEDNAERLDENGKRYLRRVCDAAQQMAELIDGLLALSRVARQELHHTRVDLTALAGKVVGRLRTREPEREVELIIAQGLTVEGDSRLLEIALDNLLSNAWKFTAARKPARIELGQQRDGAFFVRDNGAGFDAAYADKLFGVFQRLHTSAEFEGTGIGLATVQRVIQRHNGRVWAEGAVDQGATFFFTLGENEDST